MNFNKSELHSFIQQMAGGKVDEKTVLFDDLHINGLDVYSFMEQIAEKYQVDMTELDLNKYCMTEYELGNIFLTFYKVLFNRKALQKKSFPITHLYEVIEKGKWFNP